MRGLAVRNGAATLRLTLRKLSMTIVHLINNVYQLIDKNETIVFQGTFSDCKNYLEYLQNKET